MTPKKLTVKCTNVVMAANASSVQFTTQLKPEHREPGAVLAGGVPTLFAVQFEKPADAKAFDIDGIYEVTISDKK